MSSVTKTPPSNEVPSGPLPYIRSGLGLTEEKTYVTSASHSKKFSSDLGPATIPSGGFKVSSVIHQHSELTLGLVIVHLRLYSAINLFRADPAILLIFQM